MNTHFSSLYRIQITNYFILDHSNQLVFLTILMLFAISVIHRQFATIDTRFPIRLSILPGIWKFERPDLIGIKGFS